MKRPSPLTSTAPRHWAHAFVVDSIHCRFCGYDLRGLRADGRCPECGQTIWDTVLHTVDPTASRLPSLRNPVAVGNGLLMLTICMLTGLLLLLLPSVYEISGGNQSGIWGQVRSRDSQVTWLAAGAIVLGGGWALWLLAPPRGSEPGGAVWRDIWRIAVGYAGCVLFAALWTSEQLIASPQDAAEAMALHLAAAAFATIGLLGLRGVFNVIGLRSREYRRSRGGRQGLEVIILAVAAGWLASLLTFFTWLDWFPAPWREYVRSLMTILTWTSNFMLAVGLFYLVINAWWIRRALRKPPPPVDRVLMFQPLG